MSRERESISRVFMQKQGNRLYPVQMQRRVSKISFLLATVALCSCTDANSIRGEIGERVEGRFATALVANDGSGGATVPWVQRVYLEHSATLLEILEVTHARDLTIGWSGDRRLNIYMTCGEILSFVNFFDAYDTHGGFERVEIQLDVGGLCPESWPPK